MILCKYLILREYQQILFYFMNGTYLQYGTKIYMKVKNQVKLFIKTVSHFMSSVSFVQYNGAAEFDYFFS